jgi:hypothetical protein
MTASSMVFGFLRKATNPAYYGAQHMKVVNYFRQANLKSDGNPIFYGFLIAMFGAYFVDYTGKISKCPYTCKFQPFIMIFIFFNY